MKFRALTGLLALAVCGGSIAETTADGTSVAVAVVLELEGEAQVDYGSGPAALRALEALTVDARVTVSPDGHVVVGLMDGRRFRLDEGSMIMTENDRPEPVDGRITELEPVPALVRLMPLLVADSACTTRIRADHTSIGLLGLHPATGTRVSATALTLRFDPPEGYSTFRVELADRLDGAVIQVDTEESEIVVPGGALKPDTAYRWSVESLDNGRPRVSQTAVFTTLSDETTAARDDLAASAAGDAHLRTLLQTVDGALCLDQPTHRKP